MKVMADGGSGKSRNMAYPDDFDTRGVRESSDMTPFIFPTTVAGVMFGSWIALVAVEPCLLRQTDPKFDCWGSILFMAGFAGIGAALTWLLALFVRVLLHQFLSFASPKPEWRAGLLASLLLASQSIVIIQWDINVGHIGMQLFSWLGVSFVTCGISLLIINHVLVRGVK